MLAAEDHERNAARAEQVLVRVDEDVVESIDHVVEGHERDAVRGVEQDLGTDGLRPPSNLLNRQHPAGLHLDEAERQELRARRDRFDEPVELFHLTIPTPTDTDGRRATRDGGTPISRANAARTL